MRRLVLALAMLLAAPAAVSAGVGTAPSCAELRTGFRVIYTQALESSKGRAHFSRCYRTRGAGTAAVVRITGSAPQRLRIRMWPMTAGRAPDYWFSARDATRADLAAARRAKPSAKPPVLHDR